MSFDRKEPLDSEIKSSSNPLELLEQLTTTLVAQQTRFELNSLLHHSTSLPLGLDIPQQIQQYLYLANLAEQERRVRLAHAYQLKQTEMLLQTLQSQSVMSSQPPLTLPMVSIPQAYPSTVPFMLPATPSLQSQSEHHIFAVPAIPNQSRSASTSTRKRKNRSEPLLDRPTSCKKNYEEYYLYPLKKLGLSEKYSLEQLKAFDTNFYSQKRGCKINFLISPLSSIPEALLKNATIEKGWVEFNTDRSVKNITKPGKHTFLIERTGESKDIKFLGEFINDNMRSYRAKKPMLRCTIKGEIIWTNSKFASLLAVQHTDTLETTYTGEIETVGIYRNPALLGQASLPAVSSVAETNLESKKAMSDPSDLSLSLPDSLLDPLETPTPCVLSSSQPLTPICSSAPFTPELSLPLLPTYDPPLTPMSPLPPATPSISISQSPFTLFSSTASSQSSGQQAEDTFLPLNSWSDIPDLS